MNNPEVGVVDIPNAPFVHCPLPRSAVEGRQRRVAFSNADRWKTARADLREVLQTEMVARGS